MPNIPETFVAFFAILKVGAIVMPLFSGFGPKPIETRLNHGGAKVVITASGTWRRGAPAPLKSVLDAVLEAAPTVRHVVVTGRSGLPVDTPMRAGRDVWWHDFVDGKDGALATAEMAADDPAVLLYTSGTTGAPKGCVWTHIGFIGTMVTRDLIICGDFKPSDRWFFLSDMGWMVGAMCACIPSFAGGSLLIAEGTPDFPDTGRFWRLIQDHKVTFLGVSPTIVRSLMRYGDEVERYDLSSLRITTSGGEAWTEAPWRWFFEHVCKKRIPIINITGGTEVGGCILIGTTNHPMNPGSFSRKALGMGADIVDMSGRRMPPGEVGELVLHNASIGMTKSLWKDDQRYLDSYWNTIPGLWVHGDFAMEGRDGLFYILGRSDDTIKISGKRTGPAELESILIRDRQARRSGRVRHCASGEGFGDPVRVRSDAGHRDPRPCRRALGRSGEGDGRVLSPRAGTAGRRSTAHAQHENHAARVARSVGRQRSWRSLCSRQSRSCRRTEEEDRGVLTFRAGDGTSIQLRSGSPEETGACASRDARRGPRELQRR